MARRLLPRSSSLTARTEAFLDAVEEGGEAGEGWRWECNFGGSGAPALGLLRWVTSGPVSQCFSAGALPCWGNRVDLSSLNSNAEGAVNPATVTDPIGTGAPRTLPAGTFGEAAVNARTPTSRS